MISLVLLMPCLVEVLLFYFLHHPTAVKHFPYLHRAVTHLYYMHELDILQFQPQCAEYDSQLFYIMKPGKCRHRSVEFDCVYSFNKMGVRDDDTSLDQPEIIALGDSYTMGWGIKNEKTFPSLIEQESGMKTLNVAVSSYGTAREFLLLRKMDLSKLKYLIIQYCTNDFEENKQYVDNGFDLKIQSREFYENTARNHVNRVKYRPFLYSSTLLNVLRERLFGKPEIAIPDKIISKAGIGNLAQAKNSTVTFQPGTNSEDSARYFLEIVRNMAGLDSVQIIAVNISGPVYTNTSFTRWVSKIMRSDIYPPYIRNMQLVDIFGVVKKEDYFILDCHLNEEGHRKVADLLMKTIESKRFSLVRSNYQ